MTGRSARVFNLQQFSTEDGPGIRTTVFLKGCPLRCAWCHNPEGLRPENDLMWLDARCIGAQDCLRACPEGALSLTPEVMRIDRRLCTVCGKCVEACPSAAFEQIGKSWLAEELLAELLKDQVFFETSGGGLTFSGGEPMMQSEFLEDFLPACKKAGLHTALDTCGVSAWPRYAAVLPALDLVLFDIKLIDPQRHRKATGAGNEAILENARRIAAAGKPMWIRTPLIPGFTDDVDNVRAIADFIRSHLATVERWDLLAYTNLGKPKYRRLDLPYPLGDAPLLERSTVERLYQEAAAIVPCARWSGATRLHEPAAVGQS